MEKGLAMTSGMAAGGDDRPVRIEKAYFARTEREKRSKQASNTGN